MQKQKQQQFYGNCFVLHSILTESNVHTDGIPLSVSDWRSLPKLLDAWQV